MLDGIAFATYKFYCGIATQVSSRHRDSNILDFSIRVWGTKSFGSAKQLKPLVLDQWSDVPNYELIVGLAVAFLLRLVNFTNFTKYQRAHIRVQISA
jgi:hypothetical protein